MSVEGASKMTNEITIIQLTNNCKYLIDINPNLRNIFEGFMGPSGE